MLVDSQTSTPTWLVVKLGRFGRRVAVPAGFVVGVEGRAWAAFPRSWIRRAAEIDPVGGLDATQEQQLTAHYGIPSDAGRLAGLAERTAEARTSIPDQA